MKVTYIDHSGFLIDLGDIILLFDYVKGELPYFRENKKIYVFCSHSHYDHFSTSVFKLTSKFPDIKFILSNDIIINEDILKSYFKEEEFENQVTFMGKDETRVLEDVSIRTLGSTDAGVAFIVTCGNKTYYHAGDLNWWHWFGETAEYNENMEKDYKMEIKKVKGETFEIAFLPLDPRQEDAYWWGFDYFMKNTNTKTVFPMHLWGKYEFIQKFLKQETSKPYVERVNRILHENQNFEL